MNKYVVFAGEFFYPAGGWEDMVGVFDNIEDARKLVSRNKREWRRDNKWYQIVDLKTLRIVQHNRR